MPSLLPQTAYRLVRPFYTAYLFAQYTDTHTMLRATCVKKGRISGMQYICGLYKNPPATPCLQWDIQVFTAQDSGMSPSSNWPVAITLHAACQLLWHCDRRTDRHTCMRMGSSCSHEPHCCNRPTLYIVAFQSIYDDAHRHRLQSRPWINCRVVQKERLA